MKIWVLTDDRVGGNSQSVALAEKLSGDFVQKKIVYNKWIVLPNFIRRSTKIGVDSTQSDNIDSDFPDVLICAGRRLSSLALYVKRKSGGKTFVINILNPNLPYRKFDVILLPKHDNPPKRKNIIETFGSINRINVQKIEDESNKWREFFSKYDKPFVGLIIGGDTKNYKFDAIKFGEMTKTLSDIVQKMDGTLLITTSRRTSDACLRAMKASLNCKYYLYNWKKESGAKNPYFALLGLSDFLVTTGDSMSMVSEACSTGKPVYVYIPKESLGKKHLRFSDELIKSNYVKEFTTSTRELENYNYVPLNEAQRVVEIIKKEIK